MADLVNKYTEGFHGTSHKRAIEIADNGFSFAKSVGKRICFATPDNPEMAHEWGGMRADIEDDSKYSIIHA